MVITLLLPFCTIGEKSLPLQAILTYDKLCFCVLCKSNKRGFGMFHKIVNSYKMTLKIMSLGGKLITETISSVVVTA